MTAFSVTSAEAPINEPLPIRAPLSTVARIPIKQSSSTVAPCTMAAWPMVTFAPTTHGKPGSACRQARSCTLVRGPIVTDSQSPRITAPNHTLAFSPRCTLPTTVALSGRSKPMRPAVRAVRALPVVCVWTQHGTAELHLSRGLLSYSGLGFFCAHRYNYLGISKRWHSTYVVDCLPWLLNRLVKHMPDLTPSDLLERLNWRYAVKQFDAQRRILTMCGKPSNEGLFYRPAALACSRGVSLSSPVRKSNVNYRRFPGIKRSRWIVRTWLCWQPASRWMAITSIIS